jgi:hypothetical protein
MVDDSNQPVSFYDGQKPTPKSLQALVRFDRIIFEIDSFHPSDGVHLLFDRRCVDVRTVNSFREDA